MPHFLFRSNWKRAISALLALIIVVGLLPTPAFAAEMADDDIPVFAPTGDFEVNVAGATGWNGTCLPLPVYDSETGGEEIVTIPASDEAGPVPFVILEDNGGDRVRVGLVADDDSNVIAWTGSAVDGTGWVDKELIFVNLPDVVPSIAYNVTNASGSIFAAADGTEIPNVTGEQFYPEARRFNVRLDRQEYIVPCMYSLAQRLAKVQKFAMANGDTLVIYEAFRPAAVQSAVRDGLSALISSNGIVSADMKKADALGYGQSWFIASGTSNHQAGLAVDMTLAKGDPDELYRYDLDGCVYQKYEVWTEYDMPSAMHELSSAAIRWKKPVSSTVTPKDLENWTDAFVASEGAKRLQIYCTSAGLIPLASEWWHFNDPNAAKIMAKGVYSRESAVNTKGDYTFHNAPSVTPQTALISGIALLSDDTPTGGVGGLNPGTPGGQTPTRKDVAWTTDPERTFLRFTLIEFPQGVVTDLNSNDYEAWHVVGTPLNVVWSQGKYEYWDSDYCRENVVWYNSCAMQYNGMGANAAQLMAGKSVTKGIYSYDASVGYNRRWVTTADEFQAESGITDTQKEQMFHCHSSSWSTGWLNGDYTSMWGTDPKPVTDGNLYMVYEPNDAFLYLLGRLSENSSGVGWSRDDAAGKWSEYIHDTDGNLRTKYRIIIETGGIFKDPDGVRRAMTLREMMAYTLYNNEPVELNHLIYDQTSTIKNMAQYMRQAKNQFLEYPLKSDGTPTGAELVSTNGFTECDSFVDTIASPRDIRDTIFNNRRSYGLHILSPFNFEKPEADAVSLEVTKKAGAGIPAGSEWSFTVKYTAGKPDSYTASKAVTETSDGLTFTLKADETIHIDFVADDSFRYEVSENDPANLTDITGTGGTADKANNKFTSSGGNAAVTFTNDITIVEKKPVYLKLKKIAKADGSPLSGAVFSVYADAACTGTPLATLTTGADGTAVTSVPNIVEDGGSVTLYVKETTAPSGCVPLDTVFPVTCKAPENSTEAGAAQVGPAAGIENDTITEPQPVFLKLKKIAKTDGSPLSGAVFSVYADAACTGTPLAALTTGADGNAVASVPDIVENGESITLYVKETAAPEGYTPLETVFTVTAKAPENSTEAGAVQVGPAAGIENDSITTGGPDGPILYKRDAMSNEGVGPATFKFASVTNGDYEFTTNENGELEPIQWWDPTEAEGRYIKPGEYAVTEIVPPPGYEPTTEVQQIKLELDEDGNGIPAGPLVFKNLARVGLRIVKYDRQSHTPMRGVTFEIYRNGTSIGRYETDANGEILLTNVAPGTYRAFEVDTGDDSHILDTSWQEVELVAGDGTKDLFFFNDKLPGMKLVKVDSADPAKTIPGVKFRIQAVDGSYGPKEFTTDANGEIDLSKLPTGSYVVTELECPGYIIDDAQRIIHLRANDTAQFVFTNTKKPTLKLIKRSSDGSLLEGVTFRIAKVEDGSHYLDRTTDAKGEIVIDDLDPGVYSVQEIATVQGYVLDTSEHHVELFPGKTSEIRLENRKQPILTISKVEKGTNTPIPGTVFTIEGIDSDYRHDVTTGADGKATLQLEPGSYRVTEKSVPDPYCLPEDEADRTQTVSLNPDDEKTLIFKNSKKPLLTISKVDADSGEPVPGTVFTVEGIDNDYQDDWTTGADGTVALRVDPGTYRVTEKSVPAPYYLPDKDADRVQTISLNPGDEKTLRFKNHRMPELTIYKEDSVAGAPIEGAKFHVTYTSTGEAADAPASMDFGFFLTDASGEIRLHEKGKRLYPGEYTVTEVEPAPGFQMKEPTTQKVILHGGESRTLTFQNEPLNGIVVEKYDSVTHAALPGCTFQLRYLGGTSGTGGTVIGQKVTGKNGTAIWTGLKAGTYIVEEVDPADGYSILNASETVYISDDGTQSVITVRFDNAPDGILLIRKVCSVNPSVTLQDAEFKVMYADGTLIGDSNGIYRTDENGEIRIEGLKPGKSVIVTETKAPAGFIIDTQSQTIQIKEGRTVSLTFKNQPKGKLIVQKRDSISGDPLPGAQFRITTAAGCEVGLDGVLGTATLTQNGIFTTDSNGEIRISNLAPGAYVLTEIKAPSGYVMDSPSTNVVIGTNGDTQTVIVTNTPKGSLVVEKYDSVTGQPLAGAQFRITMANGELVADNEGLTSSNGLYTTNREGQIVLSKLLPGTYIVTETRAPDNYRLDPTSQTVVVNAADTQTLRFYDDPLCTLTILKRDAVTKKPLAKAEFLVRDSEGRAIGPNNGRYITGTDGTVTITGLEPNATIVVSETKAPSGYILDETPKNIVVRTGVANSLIFDDQPGTTLIIKKFIEGTENEPLSGVAFKVIDGSGAAVGPDGGIYYTDKAGEIVLSGIEPGTTVIAREIKTVEGFVLDGTPQTILIKGGEVQSLTFWNKRDCSLTILKQSTSKEPLTGAVFLVTDEDGAAIGTNNGRYTTDRNGLITITGLQPGQVLIVTEEKAPDGYVKDSTPKTIRIKQDVANSLIFENAKAGSLIINKRSSVDKATPLEGVTFKITTTNGDFLPDENGKISSNGLYYTDSNGQIILNSVVGTLVVTEVASIDGYTVPEANRSQTIEVKPDDTQTLYFYNDPLCSLTITKLDSVTGKPVPNTEFTLKDGNGNLLGRYTTGKDGTVTVGGLLPGSTIVVTETRVPSGYVLNPMPQTIVVQNGTGNTLTSGAGSSSTGSGWTGNGLVFENDPTVTLTIHKYIDGTDYEPLAGVTFRVTDGSGAGVGPDGGTYQTNSAGEIVLDGLEPGMTITAREIKTVDGFVLDGEPQSIEIQAGGGQSLTFWNKRAGNLIIRKLDSVTKKPLAGVEFKVTYADGTAVDTANGTISSNGMYVTDSNGEIHITGIVGNIIITETKTIDGYTIDENARVRTVTVNPNDTQTITIYNVPRTTLVIQKFAEGADNLPLAGVEFLVTDGSGAPVGRDNGKFVTDKDGRIVIEDLPTGMTVTVRETKTVDGYVLDTSPQTIRISEGTVQTLTFRNQKAGNLIIRKLDSVTKKPLAGVEFKLTYTDGSFVDLDGGKVSSKGIYTTDQNGEIVISGIVGSIVITETKTIPGYTIDENERSQTVMVNPEDTQTITFYNLPTASLVIQKYITGTDNEPLAGVEFLITDGTGAGVGANNGHHITDKDGRIVLDGLTDGEVLTVKEVRTADGFQLDGQPQTVKVKSGEAATLTFWNAPLGGLIIHKLDSTTKKPLAGVQFRITYADGSYVDAEGGKLATNGLFTTDVNGMIKLSGIVGTLVITEEKTIDGYTIDESTRSQTVVIKADSTTEITFYNTPKQTLIIEKLVEGTKDKPLAGVEFLIMDSDGTLIGPSNGIYRTDKYGRIYLYDLEPGTVITAKETKTVEGFVLDSTPQSIEIRSGEVQKLTFYNSPIGGLELIKVNEADQTQRIPNATFEIRKMDGGLVDTVTTGDNGRIFVELDAGNYYALEIACPKEFKVDSTPHYFEIVDGKTTTLTVTNKPFSGILIKKTDSITGKGISGVSFLLYDSMNTPIGQFTSDNNGFVYIEGLTTSGRYFLRELENKGYIVDTELKTVYVTAGETTLIEWKNTPITGQIQITKKSADYNPTNGLPAGTLLEGAVFEIYDKAGNLVDTIRSDSRGLAVSKQLPLGRYTIRETKAPANYGVNETELTAYLEHAGEIVRFEVADKSLATGVSITKTGPKEAMAGQPVRYTFSGIANNSNVRLESFYWRDTLPAAVRLESVTTGTYNFPGTYKITYRVNGGEPRTLADNLSTSKNYTLAASAVALGLASNERVTEIMFVFGQAPAGFAQVEKPALQCTVLSSVAPGSFVNVADVGGVYNGQWVQAVSRWVTKVYGKPSTTSLPRTGY